MKAFCDLHTHSVFSDGTWTPTELVRGAQKLGLSAIALTDHNTVAGLPEFLSAGAELGVETVPGVEFSVDYRRTELHMLGLFLRPQCFGQVSALLEEGVRQKEQSNIDLVNALRSDGYELDYEAIRAGTPKGQVNRAHIAAALTEKGYTASVGEAFRRLLDPELGYYRAPRRPDAFAIIRFIKSIGGVSVLAHPFLNLKPEALRVFLSEAQGDGLDGMETVYTSFDEATAAEAERIAAEFGLCRSGGSDFHGDNKADTYLGTGRGNLRVPLSFYEQLKKKQGVPA